MRKINGSLLEILLLMSVVLLCLIVNFVVGEYSELKDMYARDTVLAYNAGVRHGIEQAVDSSPDVEALSGGTYHAVQPLPRHR